MPMTRSTRRTLGGIGAVLTCPCHAVPLVLLIGGTAGSAWLGRHLPLLVAAPVAGFGVSLWLLFTSAVADDAATCNTRSPAPIHSRPPAPA